MTPQETLLLTRYVKACCPQQAIDKYTPDAWHDLLGDLSLEDCRSAVATVAKAQPFCAPSEIRAEVRRIRDDRIDRAKIPAPPPEVANGDRGTYRAALHAARVAVADGRDPEAAMRAVTGKTRREIEAP
jgi:hypothetical protein